MFKFFSALFLVATVTLAQNVDIALPTANQAVEAGSDFVVQVLRPNTLTGSEEVAIVIGFQSCSARPCAPPSEDMGTILYSGAFDPQSHGGPLPPYQNFTVVLPSATPAGAASLGVAHFALIGAGLTPFLETLNQTITVV